MNHLAVNVFQNIVNFVLGRIELTARRLIAKVDPRLDAEARGQVLVLPAFADMSWSIKLRNNADSPNLRKVNDILNIRVSVNLLRSISSDLREFGLRINYERETLRVGDVPMERVELYHCHALNCPLNASNRNEVPRCIQHEAAVLEPWRIAYNRRADHRHLVVNIVIRDKLR